MEEGKGQEKKGENGNEKKGENWNGKKGEDQREEKENEKFYYVHKIGFAFL